MSIQGVDGLASLVNRMVLQKSRENLTVFSKEMMPELDLTPFHVVFYKILDMFAKGKIKKLIVSVPPQHGKSQGSSRFLPAFMLGINPNLKILIGSYAATVAQDFNRDIQRILESPRYAEIFPETRLNGSNVVTVAGSYLRNSTVFEVVNKKGSLRALGRGGSLTSKTIDISILDDVYKDDKEANSPVVRESAWNWYTSVVQTRLHNDAQELIVFTRWHEEDLIGRLAEKQKIIDVKEWADLEDIPADAWVKINFEAIKESEKTEIDPRELNEALYPKRHNLQRLLMIKGLDATKFNCLHQGKPGSAEGRLYQSFKTYLDKSEYGTFLRSGNYTDVADEGNDYLCSICYDVYVSDVAVTFNLKTNSYEPSLFCLVTGIVYTQSNTEVTAVTVPEMLNLVGTQVAYIESNAGGGMFAKTIRGKTPAVIEAFYQGANKESRVVSNSALVNKMVVFPHDWSERHTRFHEHISKFLRAFSANTFDDAADAITGVVEKEAGNFKKYSKRPRGIKVKY